MNDENNDANLNSFESEGNFQEPKKGNKVALIILFYVLFVFGVLFYVFKANEPASPSMETLEKQVDEILAQKSEVITRKHIDKLYSLAGIYADQGRIKEAIKLYETALTANSFDFYTQYVLAKLLRESGQEKEAIEIFKQVYKYLENDEALREVEGALKELGCEVPVPEKNENLNETFEILLFPVGNPNEILLSEFANALEKALGITVRFGKKTIPLNQYDRDLYEEKRAGAERLLDWKILLKTKEEKQKIKEEFHQYWDYYGKQYFVDNILKELRYSKEWNPERKMRIYLGVTEQDIYSEDSNFLFGSSQGYCGVMSYKRFTAKYNGEFDNRVRLLDRMLKQALSTANFCLGIERCHNPYCARAYPHNLEEHDAKSVNLCEICAKKLADLKANPQLFKYKDYR